MEFRDKVVVITGGGTGIGAATALALAGQGARLVVNYRASVDEARRTAAACESAGGEAQLVQADVADAAGCAALAAAAMRRWGRIDGLVNSAGTTKFVAHPDLDGLSADDFDRILRVNVTGAFLATRACAPALRDSRGAVVMVSSIAALDGSGSSIAYAASKGALNTMTLSLARALAPEVRVNAVCPGFVETRWLQGGLGDERYAQTRARYRADSALQQTLTPQDVAATIVYLLGADKLTGQAVRLDGGKGVGPAPAR